jgi:hypothetical protein
MRKVLLTSTAVLAIGMLGLGIGAARAQGLSANIQDLHNVPVAVTTGGGNAAALNKSLDGNEVGSENHDGNGNLNSNKVDNGNTTANDNGNRTAISAAIGKGSASSVNGDVNSGAIGSYNARAATGSGDGVAASSSEGDAFATQLNGSADTVAPGALLSNGDLAATSSFNHTQLDVALATSHAGGAVNGDVNYANATSFQPDDGTHFGASINGSTGIVTQNVNAGGVAQFSTAVTALGVDNSASLFGH